MRKDSRRDSRPLAGRRGGPQLAVAIAALAVLGGFATQLARAQPTMPLPQVWSGRMLVPEGVNPGETGDSFELKVFQTSTDEEVGDLIRALKTGGQEGLRNAMFQLKSKGWIRIGKLAATEVVVLRAADMPDGRRCVRLYSDHALRLYDRTDPAGANAHPFAYLEVCADATGKGTGTLVASASLAIGDEGLKIESAGVPVIRVYDVITDKPPAPVAAAAPAAKP